MERHCRRHQRSVALGARARDAVLRKASSTAGQATVEYAVVLAAFLAVVLALGALTGALRGGLFVDHALAAASHHIGGSVSAALDVLMF